MGDQSLTRKRGRRRSYSSRDGSACSSSSTSASASASASSLSPSDPDPDSGDRRRSSRRRKEKKMHRSGSGSGERHRSRKGHRDRKQKEKSASSSSRKRRKSSKRAAEEDEEDRKRRRKRRERKERERRRSRKEEETATESDSSSDGTSGSDDEEAAGPSVPRKPGAVVSGILNKFPEVAGDLKQLLQMVDSGQAVDIRGIPNKPLVKLLNELFQSLDLKKEGGVFLLPAKRTPTLDVVGELLNSQAERLDDPHNGPSSNAQKSPPVETGTKTAEEEPNKSHDMAEPVAAGPMPRRRVIGPEMPSSELLAAAAELTAALRDAEVTDEFFIGPPPPAVAAEAESANEAERFEEIERIVGAEMDKPYDVLGVNHKMPFENIKKRYWKLSLMVHPDKCSHPQAHQAFVILNQAFKELQDPDKRKEIDDKIRLKEEEEAFKIELKALREAAQWRRLQGISLEGDEELLAEQPEAKGPPKRDEWMTQLPPERKPGMSMQSTFFSRQGKEGRGDTSAWTDSPLDRADKAKQKYLEAYNKAAALSLADNEKKSSDAELVDLYNRSKRSVSLVQKHQEEIARPKKKKSREPEKEREKEEWVGKHPWKPWDRENDLAAGRKKVNLDSESMTQGLASRFSSGTVQRNFL